MNAVANRVSREWKRIVHQVRRTLAPKTATARRKRWELEDQPFELKFHQGENYRWDDSRFFGQWDELFGSFLGFRRDQFSRQQTILDVGCGSRPVFDWFDEGCQKFFLDPLLAHYCEIEQMRAYWQEKPAATLLSQAAEQFHEPLAAACDFVNCWNVLDHTYDWRQILDNIRRYAKPGGDVLIGTDFESHGLGHPGIEDPAYFFAQVEEHFETIARLNDYVHREVALHLRKR